MCEGQLLTSCCHSERSEESLSAMRGSFAALRMTAGASLVRSVSPAEGDIVYESRLRGLLQLCAAFWAEACARIDFLCAVRAKEVGQGQFRAAVLAEFARRSHAAALGARHLRGIARRIERRPGERIVR